MPNEGLKLCSKCSCILPVSGSHTCVPSIPTINLTLSLNESAFLAWCQAYACAALSNNAPLMRTAFNKVVDYGEILKLDGINALGDRHMLLAKAAFPELNLVEMKYNEKKEMEFFTTKGDVTQ